MKKYAITAIELIISHENKHGFEIIKSLDQLVYRKISHGCNVITEQYLYARMGLLKNRWCDIEFLIDEREAFSGHNPCLIMNQVCRELGYTHLIALPAKQNAETMRRLRNRIKTEYPIFGKRIREMTADKKKES